MDWLEQSGDSIILRVYVAPRSSGNGVAGLHNGELKITLTAPPVVGAANRALVEFLAKALGVPKGDVSLVAGVTSRHKRVQIEGLTAEVARTRLLPGG